MRSREKFACTIERISIFPSIIESTSRTASGVWIRIRCTALRPYVTTHRLRFCSLRMPGRRFVWIVLGISMASSPSRLLSAAIDLKQTDFVWDAAQPVDHRGICSSIIAIVIVPSSSFTCKGTSRQKYHLWRIKNQLHFLTCHNHVHSL